jgi:hypothetical protein
MRGLLILIGVLIVGGCASGDKPAYSTSPLEISSDPTILYRSRDSWREMTLGGIRIGDPESSLPTSKVRQRTDSGWIIMRDGSRYRVKDGRIIGLGVWREDLLAKLQIDSPRDIPARFGKPDQKTEFTKEQIYHYQQEHIHIVWNSFENRLNTVNILE